ncbi:GGDEF domain-containing protein [Sphingobium aquiterrae]|uniref:GGDEF domain-containing protein n=1 Tax=Sphingobium aquiterrae TaxID=2038656 RepID=UPI0030192843
MVINALTMLLLTLGIAVIAAGFLAFEWRVVQDRALLFWSAGFASVAVGCAISPLRLNVSFLWGVWVANGLLIAAHLLFLQGIARFVGRRLPHGWLVPLMVWPLALLMPIGGDRMLAFLALNSVLVSVLTLKGAQLLRASAARGDAPTAGRMGAVFLFHGLFYCAKTILVLMPGASANLLQFKGLVIQLSLFEGILIEVLLALMMAASVRLRREYEIAALAERDPLTGVLNRRAFNSRASVCIRAAAADGAGALMLLDVDRFKSVNDTLGHGVGDRLLLALVEVLDRLLPDGALLARLGGDEFVIFLPDLDSSATSRLGNAICADFAGISDRFHNARAHTTVSIGIALMADGPVDLSTLMERADNALYEAKRRGRNQLCLWTSMPLKVIPGMEEDEVPPPAALRLVRVRA